jgi:hypothetical protein
MHANSFVRRIQSCQSSTRGEQSCARGAVRACNGRGIIRPFATSHYCGKGWGDALTKRFILAAGLFLLFNGMLA